MVVKNNSTTKVSELADLRSGCSGYFLPYCLRYAAQLAGKLTLV